jgi:hypothetical protein
MDHQYFDGLTRSLGDCGTRRAIFRLLAGGALGGLVGSLHEAEPAAAVSERRKRKARRRRRSGPEQERRSPGHPRRELLRVQAKGRKRRNRRKPRPQQPPQLPRSCAVECEELQGGTCCPDGSCATAGNCCPGKKRCPGYTECFDQGDCCPNAIPPLCKECEAYACVGGNLTCRSTPRCCAGKKSCGSAGCVEVGECCPDEWRCADGSCVAQEQCCPNEKRCNDGSCRSTDQCCPDEHSCYPGGPCYGPDTCCPNDPQPQCRGCQVLACENGQWICKDRSDQCPGGRWNPLRCRCEYCEEQCDPVTHMCQSIGCPVGHHCEEGMCHVMCTNPQMPQLCCVDDDPGRASRCTCRGANEVCYACGGICACTPGQTCCHPGYDALCPQACKSAEICR